MRGSLAAVVVVVAALALVPLALFRAEEGAYQVYVPSGYIKEVNRWIAEGKLVYDCASEELRAGELAPGEEYFLRNSYLRRDLAAWAGGDRRPFVVEREELPGGRCRGEVVAVNETYHNQRLPTYTASAWRGRLFLRQGTASTLLTSGERLIEVVRPPWRSLPLPAEAYEDAWFGSRSRDVRSPRLALKAFEEARMFASLEHIGDQAALEVINTRPALMLNGCPLPRGWRGRLDAGDSLRLRQPGRIEEHYAVEGGSEAGLVSFVSTVNGEVRRRTFASRLAMAEDVAQAIDAAVVAGKRQAAAKEEARGPARDDFDVHLTVDPFFQDELDRLLGDFARRRYAGRPLRAAVTLLEPGSGRALALASYPTAADLPRLRLKSADHQGLLTRNHNFLHHGAGSAAKPFLAAAALATRPELASLTIPCYPGGSPPPERLLGYDLGAYNLPPDCVRGVGPEVDFEEFLEVSSNRYVLFLGLLAMADWQGGAPHADREAPPLPPLDGYRLGGMEQAARPRLGVVKDESRPGLTELAGVADEAFFQRFRDLFAPVHYRAGRVVEGLDTDDWEPVLAATVGDPRDPAALAFSAVASDRVNLRANLVQQLRQDLYTTLLGLGNNRWSNLQLAEATARLVTGRAVSAHLVERVVVPAPPSEDEALAEPPPREVLFDLEQAAEPEPLQLAEESRRLILAGMRRVISGVGGTARELAPRLAEINRRAPPGVRYELLGKTGTPSADLATVRRGPTLAAPGAIEVYSGRRQVNDGVLLLAVERTQGGETSHLVLTLYIEAQGSSDQAVALAGTLLRPLVEAYWPEDWLEPQG